MGHVVRTPTDILNYPRPDGGVGEKPLRSFEDSEKMAAERAAVFFFLRSFITPHFLTFPENFVPRSFQVRSPGHVK